MAIAHKETVGNDIGTTTTPDIDNITSPASGDLLIAGVVTDSAHTISVAPSGWTPIVEFLENTGTADVMMSVYYKVAGGSEPSTYTDFLTFGGNEAGLGFVSAWTGVNTTTVLDVAAASEGSTSGTAKDSPPIEPVTAGAMLVAIFGADPNGPRTFTWDGGIDPRLDMTVGTSGYVTIGSKTWGGSGAETLGGDLNTGDPMAELVIALRPTGGTAYTLDAQDDAFTVTGVLAILAVGRFLELVPGAFTVTGAAATLARGLFVSADPGSFAVTGTAATLAAGYALNAEPGSFAVTGAAATTAAGRTFDAQPGAYTVTGVDANLVQATPGVYTVNAEPGVYTVTGFGADVIATRVLSASPATFAVTGSVADLLAGRTLNAATGAYTVTGLAAGVVVDRTLDASFGVYVITGFDAGLGDIFHTEIDAQPGTFAVTGTAADLDFEPGLVRLTTRGGRIRWNTTGRITQNKEGAVA